MDHIFFSWVKEQNIEFPIVLFVDGHKSHLILPISTFCKDNGIVLVALLPNATHILQPLDVALFKPLKAAWKNKVTQWRFQNNGEKLKKENFGPLLNEILHTEAHKNSIKNGFKACGLFLFNSESVHYNILLSNENTTQSHINATDLQNNKKLQAFESLIDKKRLEEFQESLGKEKWEGNIDDTSLFKM